MFRDANLEGKERMVCVLLSDEIIIAGATAGGMRAFFTLQYNL